MVFCYGLSDKLNCKTSPTKSKFVKGKFKTVWHFFANPGEPRFPFVKIKNVDKLDNKIWSALANQLELPLYETTNIPKSPKTQQTDKVLQNSLQQNLTPASAENQQPYLQLTLDSDLESDDISLI